MMTVNFVFIVHNLPGPAWVCQKQ